MKRSKIQQTIGVEYLTSNIENDEFSYNKALANVGKNINDYRTMRGGRLSEFLDLRFESDRLAILIETKNSFNKWDKEEIEEQLQNYVKWEKIYSDKKLLLS